VDGRTRAYLEAVGWREAAAMAALREATDALPEPGIANMRSAAEQVALLAFLIGAIGARRVLEIGCFTGYGTLGMALALPEDGRIVTLDVNAGWPELGRRYWREAGVEDRVELRLGLAADSLAALLAERGRGSFDLAYIDADKKLYESYFDAALELVRPGGIVALDNVLWHGAVADPDNADRQTETLRRLNRRIHTDPALAMVLLPLGDGLLLARRV
jgi:predicted O-methyltransferase YrrM